MHSVDPRFLQLVQQIGAIGIQGANSYNAAQADLKLDTVLSQASLATAAGTHESLKTLDRLSELNVAHKKMFAAFMTTAVSQLSAVLAELPEEHAAELWDGMVSSVNWNLKAQSEFYVHRDKWIEAASSICLLVERHRASIAFSEEGISFDRKKTLQRFTDLVSIADEIHVLEVRQTAERMSRLSASMALFGSIPK